MRPLRSLLLILLLPSLAWGDITTNLTLWWPLDTGSGTTATAGAGTSITGTLVNTPTWETAGNCRISACLGFNGSTQRITSTSLLADVIGVSAGTLTLWAFPTAAGTAQSATYELNLLFGDSNEFAGLYQGNPSSAGEGFWAYNWDSGDDRVGTTYTLNTWIHLAWVHGGGQLKIYKDGAFVAQTASANTNYLLGTMRAANFESDPTYFAGRLDEIKGWQRALVDADILEEFQRATVATAPRRRPLQWSWWQALPLPKWTYAWYRDWWYARASAHLKGRR